MEDFNKFESNADDYDNEQQTLADVLSMAEFEQAISGKPPVCKVKSDVELLGELIIDQAAQAALDSLRKMGSNSVGPLEGLINSGKNGSGTPLDKESEIEDQGPEVKRELPEVSGAETNRELLPSSMHGPKPSLKAEGSKLEANLKREGSEIQRDSMGQEVQPAEPHNPNDAKPPRTDKVPSPKPELTPEQRRTLESLLPDLLSTIIPF